MNCSTTSPSQQISLSDLRLHLSWTICGYPSCIDQNTDRDLDEHKVNMFAFVIPCPHLRLRLGLSHVLLVMMFCMHPMYPTSFLPPPHEELDSTANRHPFPTFT